MVIIYLFKCCTRQPDVLDLFFSEDTVALYTKQLERQFPSSGHLVSCLQLHVFLLGSMMFFQFIIFALCALMICCIFLVHP